MSTYKITMREVCYVEYEIEADSEEEAHDLIRMGDQPPKDTSILDYDIIDVEEYKA